MKTGKMAAGVRRPRCFGPCFVARCAATLMALGMLLAPAAAGKDKPKKQQMSWALIAGTVFRDSGFSLAGAEVVVTSVPDPNSSVKIKKIKVVSDARGEFAIRVPVVSMRYTVSVKASGLRAQEKPVSIVGEERVDVFFRLERE